jgi:hypothetical protein
MSKKTKKTSKKPSFLQKAISALKPDKNTPSNARGLPSAHSTKGGKVIGPKKTKSHETRTAAKSRVKNSKKKQTTKKRARKKKTVKKPKFSDRWSTVVVDTVVYQRLKEHRDREPLTGKRKTRFVIRSFVENAIMEKIHREETDLY